MRNVRYEQLLPHQVVEERQDCPVAFIAIGGIEWHGEHNCLGLDTVKENLLAIRCAEEIGGLVFPPLFYGENREAYLMEANHDAEARIQEKMALPAESFAPGYMKRSVYEQDRAYIELLVHVLTQIRSLGFRVIVLMAGHYPLLHHARAACEWFNLMFRYGGRNCEAWACTGYELVEEDIPDAGDHAAKWETSLMMALAPELVDMSQLPEDLDEPLVGVGGIDPRTEATKEYGEAGVSAIVAKVKERVEGLLSGERPWAS